MISTSNSSVKQQEFHNHSKKPAKIRYFAAGIESPHKIFYHPDRVFEPCQGDKLANFKKDIEVIMHTLILCNGFPPSQLLLKQEAEQADLTIGADGGGNILLSHDVTPDVVIGDLDSFQKPEQVSFEIIHDTDQECNDLEKALSYALNQGATSCTVLGAFGKRMDHSLKNLSVMKQFNSRLNPLLYKDEYQKAFLVQNYFESQLPVGTIISLFPLSGRVTGITTTGLKYPLKDEELVNGERDGTSNENIQPAFSIEVGSGDLVVFVELRPVEQRTPDIEL